MTEPWRDYQLEVAQFFRELGLYAETDVRIQGVRTTHDIDVLVRSQHAGFDITWLVECKLWQGKVSKLHVLALREIVADAGADRGILLSEAGFQSGAIEAAALTNVHVSSLANVKETASSQVAAMRLRELYDRIETCRTRYWNIAKSDRIEHGIRPDVGASGYSGDHVIAVVTELLTKAFRGAYPVQIESIYAYISPSFARQIRTPEELIGLADSMVSELEAKLDAYAPRADYSSPPQSTPKGAEASSSFDPPAQ